MKYQYQNILKCPSPKCSQPSHWYLHVFLAWIYISLLHLSPFKGGFSELKNGLSCCFSEIFLCLREILQLSHQSGRKPRAQLTIFTSTMKDMFAAYVLENVSIKEMGFETILKVQKRSNTSFADKFPWRWKHHKKNICQRWPWSIWMLYHESTKNREIGHSQLWTLKSTKCKSKSPTWINRICKSSRLMLASQARPWVSNVPSGTRSLPPSWWNTTEDLRMFFWGAVLPAVEVGCWVDDTCHRSLCWTT